MRIYFSCLFVFATMTSFAQLTPYENSGKKATTTYNEAISYYQALAKSFPKQTKLLSYGQTDFGKPLHLLVLSNDGLFEPSKIKQADKRVLLINNGIHPGEPEGIDASMMLARDILKNHKLPKNVVICIIPVYNIDGSFNRTSTSRANQNGPLAYGFRGNSKNYDLNRDFIKTDSKNSESFQQIFNIWEPEIFVDTHTSNGADYQYTMTLIPTQKDKLNPILAGYLTKTMLPSLYSEMKTKGFELIPYINAVKEIPDNGISGFMESPRYSTGYSALHNTIGFMPETHMLKPYDQRVESTYKLLQTYIDIVERDAKIIGENKAKADETTANQKSFAIDWKLNREQFDEIEFKGYAAKYKTSEVSGLERLYYDRNEPYTKTIKQWNNFEPALTIEKPLAYIIPKAWDKVIKLLKLNNVKVDELNSDVKLDLEMYYIADMKTAQKPFEGHYLHSVVKIEPRTQTINYYAGDYVVYTNQKTNRYIIETLEPQAPDSFFNWNFFDAILGQKEHFSSYIFEDTAAELLKKNPSLKQKLEEEKAKNPELIKSAYAQLEFIYKNSDYFEPTFMRYPVGRLVKEIKLDIK
ncbi:M14 family metallopeptidase [Pedobacter xixiisoli]|uniref:Zinc carboxypeptidase n=1 Tax=Pedobacter xixiisoli TaxID=1476464 RepID=A0A286ACN9_9SPHI|nr:M14 family metallopeptidase [Pedobacter xixiisoli]SOD19679.1 Zinc carboxypeptidase [Pedobacter xixiisoli]